MKSLTVLYDPTCGFCSRCRTWLESQPKFLPLEFVAANSAEAQKRYPSHSALNHEPGELVVIGDDGAVYQGPSAFIMCLYALADYRELSIKLSQPSLMPLAAKAFKALSENRKSLSELLRLKPEAVANQTVVVDSCDAGCSF